MAGEAFLSRGQQKGLTADPPFESQSTIFLLSNRSTDPQACHCLLTVRTLVKILSWSLQNADNFFERTVQSKLAVSPFLLFEEEGGTMTILSLTRPAYYLRAARLRVVARTAVFSSSASVRCAFLRRQRGDFEFSFSLQRCRVLTLCFVFDGSKTAAVAEQSGSHHDPRVQAQLR